MTPLVKIGLIQLRRSIFTLTSYNGLKDLVKNEIYGGSERGRAVRHKMVEQTKP